MVDVRTGCVTPIILNWMTSQLAATWKFGASCEPMGTLIFSVEQMTTGWESRLSNLCLQLRSPIISGLIKSVHVLTLVFTLLLMCRCCFLQRAPWFRIYSVLGSCRCGWCAISYGSAIYRWTGNYGCLCRRKSKETLWDASKGTFKVMRVSQPCSLFHKIKIHVIQST